MLVIYSIISMVGLAFIFAGILFFASRRLKVEEDARLEELENALAGLNCGVCGYASCRIAAETMIKGETGVDICLVGGEEVTKKIAQILGKEVKKEREKYVAVVECGIDSKTRQITSFYRGIETCRARNLIMQGGMKCKYGCLGLGDCKRVCPVEAIKIINGKVIIDIDLCIGCGLCVKTCPRKIITLYPFSSLNKIIYVACSNPLSAGEVRKVCKVGCIACRICEKLSEEVFEVKNNLSRINWTKAKDKVIDWEKIIDKCPTHCILQKQKGVIEK